MPGTPNTPRSLPPLPSPAGPSALERLGPSPFPRSRFPFLGFLATVYDHLAATSQRRLHQEQDEPYQEQDEPQDSQ